MQDNQAKKIIKKVEKDYDAIAKEWDISRRYPKIFHQQIVKDVKKGDKILDAGCGNALLYDVLATKSIDYTGLDISQKLLNFARKRIKNQSASWRSKAKFIKGSIIKMPFKNNEFDKIYALAVLHHFPDGKYQEQAVKEIYRVLKKGGKAYATVWNLYSDYAKEKFKLNDQIKNLPSGWDENDLFIPWKATAKKTVLRYVYRFDKRKLEKLFKSAGFRDIKIDLKSAGNKNFVLTAKK